MMSFANRPVKISSRGEHPPGVGLRPGDVDEVVQKHVWARSAHEVGERVEVVVVHHHHRLLAALELLDHGPREILVDDVVAELERLDLGPADVGRVGEIPQVVLDEPQHRVGEHVVEAVVRLWVAVDEAHLQLPPRGGGHRERAPAVSARDLHVVLAHRRGDPHRLAVGGQTGQRRHQTARTALHLSPRLEGHRPPIGHQHQRGAQCRCLAHDSRSSLKIRR
jgi:hypothetical protein